MENTKWYDRAVLTLLAVLAFVVCILVEAGARVRLLLTTRQWLGFLSLAEVALICCMFVGLALVSYLLVEVVIASCGRW